MITYYFRTLKDSELKKLEAPRAGVWVHAVAPTEAEMEGLIKEFALDDAILEDITDFFEVPRMERSRGVGYFFTRYPFDQNEEDVDSAPLLIVMGESFVLTISPKQVPQFKSFVDGKEVVHTTQKAKLFIQIMKALTESFEKKLVRLRRAVHRDRAQLRQIGSREIVRFVNYEHELNDMIAAVVPTNTWLRQVTSGNYMALYNDDLELMEDLMIANSQMVESARLVLKTIQNVRNASEAILANNLNATIRTLTIITILLTIPNIVSSLYGMNVSLPGMNSGWAFWLIVGVILAAVATALFIFKRSKWL